MTFSTWLAYFIATLVICVSPGPGALSSMSAGMKYGFARGLWNLAGLQAAIVVNVFAIWIGLGALLVASTTAFDIMKYLGAAYLIYLGIQKFREEPVPFEQIAAQTNFKDTSPFGIFKQGLLVNLTNPKGLLFLAAVLPQFIDPAKPTAIQYAILGGTMVVVDVVVMIGYTALASTILRMLKDPNHIRWTNRGVGSLFVAAGGALAVLKRA
ncbi:MAG: LysE family transporter [Burkholderiales bacterium]|jgi:homoserine/homoserine lactone efflux protein|nr:LysE family transporter [Betaproteobacteria bacterium]